MQKKQIVIVALILGCILITILYLLTYRSNIEFKVIDTLSTHSKEVGKISVSVNIPLSNEEACIVAKLAFKLAYPDNSTAFSCDEFYSGFNGPYIFDRTATNTVIRINEKLNEIQIGTPT
jgi:hypothetical protein